MLSLVAAGVLDVVYARYSGKRPVTGAYLFVIGGVVIMGQGLVLAVSGSVLTFDIRTTAYGVCAGAVAMVANALLIESLARINVSLGSTIYRLNTIAVVIVAVVFLHEALTLPKIAGIALGVAAVVLLYQRGGRGGDHRGLRAATAMVVVAALLRAAFGIMSKVGLADGAEPFLFMLHIGIGWTVGALVYGVVRKQPPVALRDVLPYAIASGTLICLVVTFLLLGLRTGEASVVIPIANLSFMVALLTSAAFGMERITRRKLVAVGCAAVAIVLLTMA